MKNKKLEKLADTYTLQKIVGAAGYTSADKEVNNNPKTIMNSKFRMKNRITKNNITRTPIKNRKKAYKEMEKYWDETGYNLSKDLFLSKVPMPFPPRQGLVYDNVKHRWTRPDKAGKTVTEVSGKKRFRGTGTGTHSRAVQTKRGLKRGEATLRFREAGEKRAKLIGSKAKAKVIAARKKKLNKINKKHKR
tara:strand:+ start:265 stop:837 length:573 start_codon:yes stop_codon:yes gene_type:complete